MATNTHNSVNKELEEIRSWHEEGEPEASIPKTPFLDRIQQICDHAKVSRVLALEMIKIYSDRNEFAHRSAPRIGDFTTGEMSSKEQAWEVVNWEELKNAIDVKKTEVKEKYDSGVYTKEQYDIHKTVLDQTWSELSDNTMTTDGTLTVTERAKQLAGAVFEAKKRAAQDPPVNLPSFYKKGKWDDLLPKEESK